MELPLYMKDAFGYHTGLAIAVFLGVAFGFVLERAGFGRASVLAAQFYLTDTRVLKVMFTSIVTALLGMTILSGVGVLDLGALSVPHTYLWPQLVGGLLLGAGFIISGYCPGTGVVAMASGKLDGLFAIVGVMAGSLLFGFAFPWVEGFYHSGDLGVLRIPDLVGLPQAVIALGVTLMAVGAFVGAEKLEHMTARRNHEPVPAGSAPLRRQVFAGLTVGAVLGLLVLLLPQAGPARAQWVAGEITPIELAERMIERPSTFYLVDVRPPGEGETRLPGAMTATSDDPACAFVADLPTTRTLIVYGAEDTARLPDVVQSFEGEVLTLRGGYTAFAAEILAEPVLGDDPTADDIERFRHRSALHAYFTGAEIQSGPPAVRPKKLTRAAKKGAGC